MDKLIHWCYAKQNLIKSWEDLLRFLGGQETIPKLIHPVCLLLFRWVLMKSLYCKVKSLQYFTLPVGGLAHNMALYLAQNSNSASSIRQTQTNAHSNPTDLILTQNSKLMNIIYHGHLLEINLKVITITANL